jgi:hypothetical protein
MSLQAYMIEDLLQPRHLLLLIFLVVPLGLIPAAVAQSKGSSFFVWWVYGAALFIVALPHALMMKTDVKAIEASLLQAGDSRKCPFCAEIIKREAVVCRYCGRDVPAVTFTTAEVVEPPN